MICEGRVLMGIFGLKVGGRCDNPGGNCIIINLIASSQILIE
jgi:hypothetical protein